MRPIFNAKVTLPSLMTDIAVKSLNTKKFRTTIRIRTLTDTKAFIRTSRILSLMYIAITFNPF